MVCVGFDGDFFLSWFDAELYTDNTGDILETRITMVDETNEASAEKHVRTRANKTKMELI